MGSIQIVRKLRKALTTNINDNGEFVFIKTIQNEIMNILFHAQMFTELRTSKHDDLLFSQKRQSRILT